MELAEFLTDFFEGLFSRLDFAHNLFLADEGEDPAYQRTWRIAQGHHVVAGDQTGRVKDLSLPIQVENAQAVAFHDRVGLTGENPPARLFVRQRKEDQKGSLIPHSMNEPPKGILLRFSGEVEDPHMVFYKAKDLRLQRV